MLTSDRLFCRKFLLACFGATFCAASFAAGVPTPPQHALQSAQRLLPTDTPSSSPSPLPSISLTAPASEVSEGFHLPDYFAAKAPTDTVTIAPPTIGQRAGDLIENALGLVGVNYRRGGNSAESGLDCSGLVRLVFRDSMGMDLPRRAVEMSKLGVKIGLGQLKPGDLVFYRTVRRTISHVGIYLGEGRFIHAPRSGEEVRVEDMNQPYWTKRFSEARRLGDAVN